MIEGVFLAAIFVAAVVFALRPWYRAFTGKKQECVGCPGHCGHSRSCPYHQDRTEQDADT